MLENSTWLHPLFIRLSLIACGFSLLAYVFFYLISKVKPKKYVSIKASFVSWLLIAPIFFFLAGLPSPFPVIATVFVGIYSAKTFFRMTGMYHKSSFVLSTYGFIALQGYFIQTQVDSSLIYTSPMIYLLFICCIPIILNSFENMIQYIALSLMAFLFFGWGLMHFVSLLQSEMGIFICIYLLLLSEFNEGVYKIVNMELGRLKPLKHLSSKLTIEGFLVSGALTVFMAWALRSCLPDRSYPYWLAAGIFISILGRIGSLTLTTIRKDLGIKGTDNVFIIGKDDILARVDKLVFVVPSVYYIFINIEKFNL